MPLAAAATLLALLAPVRASVAHAAGAPRLLQSFGEAIDFCAQCTAPNMWGPWRLPNPGHAGNVVVVVASGEFCSPCTVTDNQGDVFSNAAQTVWYTTLSTNGAIALSFGPKGPQDLVAGTAALWAGEYSGIDPKVPLRGSASVDSSSSATTPAVMPSAVPGDLLIGALTSSAEPATGFSVPAPYTEDFALSYVTERQFGNAALVVEEALTGPSYAQFSTASTNTRHLDAVAFATDLPGPPGVPSASPGQDQASLSWLPPTVDGGSPVLGYVVAALPASGGVPVLESTGGVVPKYTFPGLTPGVSYTFTVAAQNAMGLGAPSQPSPAVVPTGPAPDLGLVAGFSYGELQQQAPGASVCGPNPDGEPAVHISQDGNVYMGSERSLGGGSDLWVGVGLRGGAGAAGCGLQYAGQPDAAQGVGAAGSDIDIAVGSATVTSGSYPLYVASLNQGSVSVSHSTDNGVTFSDVPVQAGLPLDDREWIAAYGAATSVLTFHDASSNIDVLRSDDGGLSYAQVARAIPDTDYKALNNGIGNLVIDRRNSGGAVSPASGLPGFWAYQAFVAPSQAATFLPSTQKDEVFVARSNDGGVHWTDLPVPCSMSSAGTAYGLGHVWPVLSADPSGSLWAAWSDGLGVSTARSTDQGGTWACSGTITGTVGQAIEPWIVATSAGIDLAFYGTPTVLSSGNTASETWSVYFVQDLSGTVSGWGAPQQLMPVHIGPVCLTGINCSGNRQLFEDFGIDTDQSGWAHIAYSHDAPSLGGSGSYTGYAVQVGGSAVGYPN